MDFVTCKLAPEHASSRTLATVQATEEANVMAKLPISHGNKSLTFHLGCFAGARKNILNACPDEIAFFNGLGLAVLATSVVSGTTLALALGYTLRKPATHLWPIAVIWALIVLNIDRLLLMLTAKRHLALALIPRVVISFVIGVMIAEVVTLWIYNLEINSQMERDVQQQIQVSTQKIANFYGPQINADRQTLTTIQSSERALVAQINKDIFLSNCESSDPICSVTHQPGCGTYCLHYRQLAASAQQELDVLKSQDATRIRALQSHIAQLSQSEAHDQQVLTSTERVGTGLIAREGALTEIEHAHPGILLQVWFIRFTLILLDLMPLIIKSLYLAFGNSSYEAIAESYRRREHLAALNVDLQVRIERSRLHEQATADEAINRVRIQGQRDFWIANEEAQWYGMPTQGSEYRGESDRPTRSEAIMTPNFTDFVASMKGTGTHESLPVKIPRHLANAGWVGTALLTTLMLTLHLISHTTHQYIAGESVAMVALIAVAALAIFTRGFRQAPAWAIRATFAALLLGLGLPVLVTALNL
jgi:hypothetical protein